MNLKEIYYWVFDEARTSNGVWFKIKISTIRNLSATEYDWLLNKVFDKKDMQCMFFKPPKVGAHLEVIDPDDCRVMFFDYVFEGMFNSIRPFTYNRGTIQDD